MGKKDIVENNLLVNNDIFADVINVTVFHGRDIIQPEELEDADPRSVYTADDGEIHRQERDVLKYWKKHGFILSVLGIENQTKADKYMAGRLENYDGAAVGAQLRVKGVKRLYPVLSLVLYYGKTHWKYSRDLIDLYDIPEYIEEDYKAKANKFRMDGLIEVSFLDPETVKMFKSDFRIVADYCVQTRTNKEYKPSSQEIKHVNEIFDYMKAVSHKDWSSEYIETLKEKGEPITMESAYKEVMEKSEAKGRNEGRMETASRILAGGKLSIQDIAEYSDLSVDEVMKLSKKK